MKERHSNANHLLNFQPPARDSKQQHHAAALYPHRKHGVHTTRAHRQQQQHHAASHVLPYEKGRYVQANYRFLVRGLAGHYLSVADPDLRIDWSIIEQVLMTTENVPQCPICLETPRVPRMTECGHVFCFPCLLHYLSLSEKRWRKCPICYESIYASALHSVEIKAVTHLAQELQLRQREHIPDLPTFAFCLMQRATSSISAMPRKEWRAWSASSFPALASPDTDPWHPMYRYAKCCLVDAAYIADRILLPEKDTLQVWKREAIEDPFASDTLPFLDKALRAVDDRLDATRQCFLELGEASSIKQARKKTGIDGPSSPPTSHTTAVDTHHSGDDNMVFYYQSEDGQPVYLSQLDVNVLKAAFLTYAAFPHELVVPIESVQEITITDDIRKRSKQWRHLPIGCDVTICDVILKDVVPDAVLEQFKEQYQQRAAKKEKKKVMEAKAEKKAQAAILQAKEEEERRQRRQGPYRGWQNGLGGVDMAFEANVVPTDLAAAFPAFERADPGSQSDASVGEAQATAEASQDQTNGSTRYWGPKIVPALPTGDAWGPTVGDVRDKRTSPTLQPTVTSVVAERELSALAEPQHTSGTWVTSTSHSETDATAAAAAAVSNSGGQGGSKKKGQKKVLLLSTTNGSHQRRR